MLVGADGLWSTPYDASTADYRELPVPPTVRDAVRERCLDAGLSEVTMSLHGPNARIHDALVGVKGAFISRATRQREVAVEFLERHMLSLPGLRGMDRAEPIGAPASQAYLKELLADPVVGPRIAGIVANWPTGARADRAAALGLQPETDFADIIRQYIADCRAAHTGAGTPEALKGLA